MEKTVARIGNFMDPESVKARTEFVVKVTTSSTLADTVRKIDANTNAVAGAAITTTTKTKQSKSGVSKKKKARGKVEGFLRSNEVS